MGGELQWISRLVGECVVEKANETEVFLFEHVFVHVCRGKLAAEKYVEV